MAKLDSGFDKASSDNLPEVFGEMINDFYVDNLNYISAEMRGVKAKRSTKESYGDSAVHRVQLKRIGNMCTVKAKITPETKLHQSAYNVIAVIDESESKVVSCQCVDCSASAGGCKHATAFLFWLHRRSEEPSVTSTTCYWQKSKLSQAVNVEQSMANLLETQSKKKPITLGPKNPEFLDKLVTISAGSSGMLFEMVAGKKEGLNEASIHYLFQIYSNSNQSLSADKFIDFAKKTITTEMCKMVEVLTRDQSKNSTWKEMRYCRITASKLYEVSRCKTAGGATFEKIMGADTALKSEAVKRGVNLEQKVIEAVCKQRNIQSHRCGLFLNKDYPLFGASPDGISEDYVPEIKCPFSDKTKKNYIKDGAPTKNFFYQVQMQMFFANRTKGLFCVAAPDFETTGHVDILEVNFNKEDLENVMEQAQQYWENFVFPSLL